MPANPDHSADEPTEEMTIFRCGPSRCDHDYSGTAEYTSESGAFTSTAVCVKCGAHAIDEDMWR